MSPSPAPSVPAKTVASGIARDSSGPAAHTTPPPLPGLPPEWAIERFIKAIGRGPKAVGKMLDAAAKVPVLGDGVRFFSSVWVGISLLISIAAYVAIGSGFPGLREAFEITDLQFFDAWPMRILLALLALDLSVVTLRRIPLTLFKLGSWTVHIGILTLISGCVWYFSHKEEGSVRIYLNHSVNYCYDVTERALFAYPMNADGSFDTEHPVITPLPTLPIYAEHLAENGNGVDLTLGPGALPDKNATVHITGYYPAALLRYAGARPAENGETGQGPAIDVVLSTDSDTFGEHWLMANSPAQRVLDLNFPFSLEYLYHPTAKRVKDLQASFDGPMGITVRIPKLGIERTYAVAAGTPIAVEGSNYTITPDDAGEMPMASKGYEDAVSSYLRVDVSRKDGDKTFNYQRMCLSRYPERSPDFIEENGKMARKQDGVDPDIEIIYHDAQQTHGWIVEDESGGLSLIVRTPDGQSTTVALGDKGAALPVHEVPGLVVKVSQRLKSAVAVMEPAIIPPEERPLGQTVMEILQFSMIDLDVSEAGATQTHEYVPFSPYAEVGDRPNGQPPTVVETAQGKVGLLLATVRRPLPSTLTLTKFEPVKYPGALHSYEDYVSTIAAKDPGEAGTHTLVTRLNNPAADHGLYYFQAAWDGDDNAPAAKRFSVIGVANRPGVPVMVIGAALIVLGIGYAFYVKPLLLKAKKEQLVAWNARRQQ